MKPETVRVINDNLRTVEQYLFHNQSTLAWWSSSRVHDRTAMLSTLNELKMAHSRLGEAIDVLSRELAE